MLRINKKSEKLVLVLHEIYGINQHMVYVCELLAEQDFDVICPDLLEQGNPYDYAQEQEAYHNFVKSVGFTNALHKVKTLLLTLQKQYTKIYIMGFSIGATVAWLCSQEDGIDGIVGYYGSRIRDFADLKPKCPVLLFFPKVENSFNVDELVYNLNKPNIKVHTCEGEHGFSDPYSSKYNEESARHTFGETLSFLKCK
ncbi:dienelactone hydrolase family protein [Ureibacillus aquaedulcis]|uniref:Dienelactone hydrolase family protein n=1 Tax=Ureibacillus aquaedulcis TaxID=3058421 RepID=A0ABT8GSR4_9BACL|nr:dienelactone hydrolase family protein [Ureibacillus sp. BA0131]MDN4494448.1 dienelactone hydrolase family protein [Ureibacillus sp. BA0131]